MPVRERRGQQRNVLEPVAQRRQFDRHHVEPVIEVFAKTALRNQRRQVAVGRRNHPHIALHLARAADPGQAALLEDAQERGLEGQRHRGNLVEQKGPAVGLLETALRVGGGRR